MNVHESLVLRAAHISEAGAIASMSRLLVEHGLNWRWTPSRVRKSIRDRETMVLVANIDGKLSGFAIMKFRDADSHLFLLAVAPEMQRAGIGAALLAWLEKSCQTAGMRYIRVEVRAGNQKARKFYDRSGFRFIGQVAGYYDRHEPAVVMVKTLARSTIK
jgi:ribosomal-protein-alanine N-acetyltransferase